MFISISSLVAARVTLVGMVHGVDVMQALGVVIEDLGW